MRSYLTKKKKKKSRKHRYSVKRDKPRRAKKPGRRVSKSGKTYYENRRNRSDKNPSSGL